VLLVTFSLGLWHWALGLLGRRDSPGPCAAVKFDITEDHYRMQFVVCGMQKGTHGFCWAAVLRILILATTAS
jgi:hypothetical protein